MQIKSQKKQNEIHLATAMTTVMPLVLVQLRLKFPDFILNKDHAVALPTIQWGELRQNAWKPYGNLSKTLCPTLKSWNEDICFSQTQT